MIFQFSFFITDIELQTSCLTEIFFEKAQERAKHLDALRAKGEVIGPLHGLPISLKDSFQVRDTDATLGFIAYLENGPSQENSYMVDTLLNLGAVLYCKTNIPQTLMVCYTDLQLNYSQEFSLLYNSPANEPLFARPPTHTIMYSGGLSTPGIRALLQEDPPVAKVL